MTRSSTEELFTPFKDPKREIRSSRKLFKTLSLDESKPPRFDLLSDLEEAFEEEVAKTMAETMEQYMSKTRTDYRSGVARPKIENKDQFELKGQFLKKLRENTFSGSDHEDANEHIEKVLKIVDLFHIPNITVDQLMLQVFPISLTGAVSRWLRNEPIGSIKTWEDLKTKFLNKYFPPGRTAKKMEEINNFQQEPNETLYQAWERFKELLMKFLTQEASFQLKLLPMQKWPSKKWQKTIKNGAMEHLDKKGNYGPQFLEAYGTSHINNTIPRKEKYPGSSTLPCYINNACFDNALVDLGASVSVMPLSTYLNLGLGELAHTNLIVELANRTVKYPKGIVENVLVEIGKFVFPVDFIILDMLEDIKVLLILERPFLSTAQAKIDVFKRKITLRVGDDKIIFKSVKPASSLIKRVYMISLIERMELDLEARLTGETLVINRSLDPLIGDYIEPLELRRNQVNDLMPTIEEGEVIDAPMDDLVESRNDELDTGIDDYPSDCDYDKKIYIDCAYNLKFSCMIGFDFVHVNFFPILYVNLMSKKFYNTIMKEKLKYKGNNVVESLMNVPIFVRTFSVITDFAVLEDMDAYRDEGMGDVIVGEPFLREVGIKARRFEGMITLYKCNENVTYQMVRSHPMFKNHTNQQCNKIPPLLKVRDKDKMNGILHSYQNLKGFYKGVLNLGPNFILVPSMEKWLTRGHISMHEME
ncbi:putative reverse transcriptase domain-containing protein [Tanacetum coccineum]